MPGPQTLYVLILHGLIALAVVVASTILAYHGAIDGQTVSVVYGAALGLAGASAASIATLGQAVNGKSVVSAGILEGREETLRQAIQTTAPVVEPPQAQATTHQADN